MKVWAIVFVLGLIPTAVASETLIEESIASARHGTAPACASEPLRPFGAVQRTLGGGSVVARVVNEGGARTARFCLFDVWGNKRADVTTTFAAGARRDVEIPAPSGTYTIRMESDGLTASANMHTRFCSSSTADTDVMLTRGGGSIRGGSCVGRAAALAAFSLFGSTLAIVFGKAPHLGAFLLYSRLAKPRLLDSALRSRLHTLVAHEPGIHSRELGRALGAAEGQIAHHLGILHREKLLASMGAPGFRHWFVAGRFSPEQMRAIATLRDPTRRALYEAVVARPGASLGDVTAGIGVSLPQASRAAKALEKAGLIERRAQGRALALRAIHGPGEIYGAERASA